MHPALNPNSYVALALYEHGLAKPMQYAELQALVRMGVLGCYPGCLQRWEPVEG